jgi:hypothetical protein
MYTIVQNNSPILLICERILVRRNSCLAVGVVEPFRADWLAGLEMDKSKVWLHTDISPV